MEKSAMQQINSGLSYVLDYAREFDKIQWSVSLGVLIAAYLIAWSFRRRKFPPGPRGWPIVGYLPHLSKNTHLDLIELGKKYGDVFSVNFGAETVAVLHGVAVIQDALGRPEFLGRPPEGGMKLFFEGSAFFVEDVHKWREQRRFVVHAMKDLGLGRTVIEGDILNEIRHFLDILASHKGKPMDLKDPLSPSISNNICSLAFGKRFEHEDEDRIFLDNSLSTASDVFSKTTLVGLFPWLLRVPWVRKHLAVEKGIAAIRDIKDFIKREITKHKETFDERNDRDFIDCYIVEMEARKKKDPNTTLTDEALACNVMDLFTAGSDSVRNTLLWCVYVVAAFPDAQERIREEILEVMGPHREPEIRDLKSAPFAHSFILEVMRWKTITPLGVPRCTLEDTILGGCTIPKNTTVFMNMWNVHHSPDLWSDPESFVPNRFIAKDGKTVSRPAHFMPFSMGKRVCPGEPMAIMEMFLYFTSILQKFQVAFPEGYKPTFKSEFRGTYVLQPYKIRFIPRH